MENRQGLGVDVKHLHGLAFTAAASRRWGGGEREGLQNVLGDYRVCTRTPHSSGHMDES